MKQNLFRLSLLSLLTFVNMIVFAYDFEVNGIYYNVLSANDKTVKVTNSTNKYSGDIVIPESINYNGSEYSVTSIGDDAFKGCSSLTSVTIPNSVTSIEYDAFKGCSNLTLVTIPNSVTSIKAWAFQDCSSLTSVTIPNNLTLIQGSTFSGCSSLTSVTIPNSVTSIEESAFSGCSSLTSVTIPNSVTSIGRRAFSGCSCLTSVTIPNSVTSIKDNTFSNCSSLTSVTIPNSVTSIKDNTFSNCSSLTSVTIPNSVTTIGERVFNGCSCLTSVTIPNSVTSIGDYSFFGCNKLTSIILLCPTIGCWFSGVSSIKEFTLGDGVTSIQKGAFKECSDFIITCHAKQPPSLTDEIEASELVVPLGSIWNYSNTAYWNGINAIYARDNNKIIVGISLREEGESVVRIPGIGVGDYEVDINDIIEIVAKNDYYKNCVLIKGDSDVSETFNNSGKYTFRPSLNPRENAVMTYAYQTQNIQLSSSGSLVEQIDIDNINSIQSLKVIGNVNGTDILVIRKMTNLKILDLQDANIVDGGSSYYENYVTSKNAIGDYFFKEKNNLIKVVLPKTITTIKNEAFSGCSSLITIDIPLGVTTIGYNAFKGCGKLPRISIPSSIISIEENAFEECNSLETVVFHCRSIGNWFKEKKSIKHVIIGDEIESIDREAFRGCSINTVDISNIEDWCRISFGSWVESSSNKTYMTTTISYFFYCFSNPISNAKHFRLNGKEIVDLVIPNTVENISSCAFYGYKGFKSVVIGGRVKTIGAYAFSNCTNLQSVKVPNSVTSIGHGAFNRCNINSVYVDDIKSWCYIDFNTCEVYKVINTGANHVSKIEYDYSSNPLSISHRLLLNNERVTDLVIPNEVEFINNNAFIGCREIISVTIPNSVTSIGKNAFSGCSGLTSVTLSCPFIESWFSGITSIKEVVLGNQVQSVNSNAFSSCSGLTSLTIGNQITSIGDNAFYGCSSLTSVDIPNSVTSIGYRAFSGCDALVSLGIGHNVNFIGDEAFLRCNSLMSVDIPNSVTSIGNSSFNNCSSLTSVDIPNSVTSIGNYSFAYCSSLTSVDIPNSVTSIGDGAFSDCYALASLRIGRNVETIGEDAFNRCHSLKLVTIPDSVTSIGKNAFAECDSLISVTIGKNVVSIGNDAFNGCNELSSVNILCPSVHEWFSGITTITKLELGNGVESISYGSFSNCSGLTTVTIGSGVKSIDNSAFSGCTSLVSITSLNPTPPEIFKYTFEDKTYSNAELFVPKGSKTLYWLHPYWEKFYNIKEIDVTGIDNNVMDYPATKIGVIHNLKGEKVKENSSDLKGLPKGIYIINGKKVIVK